MLTEIPAGLYCAEGDFYVDPWGSVPRAVITHAHGDHARTGSEAYLCAADCAPLLSRRFGPDAHRVDGLRRIAAAGLRARELSSRGSRAGLRAGARRGSRRRLGGVRRLQARSGSDVRAVRARPVRHLRHRSTFGLPIYRWDPTAVVIDEIIDVVARQRRERPHVGRLLLHHRQGAAAAR